MTIRTEAIHTGEHILTEAGGAQLCREEVTITGSDYPPGKVLGKITADGSGIAAAILYAAVDAGAADRPGVISARLSAVSGDLLDWIAGIQQADKGAGIAALAANDIIVR